MSVKEGFKLGMGLFIINLILGGSNFTPLLLITAHISPGFIFGFFLIREPQSLKHLLFIILSGILYFYVSYFIVRAGDDEYPYIFIIVATLSAITLYLFYYILIFRQMNIIKGVALALLVGVISSIIPILSEFYISEMNTWLKWACLFSVFPIWQSLFVWTLLKSKVNSYTILNPILK